MKVFPKQKIHPILLPCQLYFSNYKCFVEYREMNPSMYIDTDGHVTILIRCVVNTTYPKNEDTKRRKFTVHDRLSESVYYMLKTTLIQHDHNRLCLDDCEFQKLSVEYNLPTYTSMWKGIEDIRFIDKDHVLVIVPELNERGNPSIFRAKLHESKIYDFEHCYPNIQEKNWMPFLHHGNIHRVVYNVYPFQIKSIIENDISILDSPSLNTLDILKDGYHGSSNAIPFNNGHLFLIHKNDLHHVYHRWLHFNDTTNEIQVSTPFLLFTYSYIEFPCSLCIYNDIIYVSLGVNDNKAFIIELSVQDVIDSFLQ